MTERAHLTIALTGRPPVRIAVAHWPILAEAADIDYHGAQMPSQANRETDYRVKVRQHDDGRAIVYATYRYSSHWEGERGHDERIGRMLTAAEAADDGLLRAIEAICAEMGQILDDDVRLARLARECIADLPAVEV